MDACGVHEHEAQTTELRQGEANVHLKNHIDSLLSAYVTSPYSLFRDEAVHA
jgi:hypothetical protein